MCVFGAATSFSSTMDPFASFVPAFGFVEPTTSDGRFWCFRAPARSGDASVDVGLCAPSRCGGDPHGTVGGQGKWWASAASTSGSPASNHLRAKKFGKNGHEANINTIPRIRPPMPTRIGVWIPNSALE